MIEYIGMSRVWYSFDHKLNREDDWQINHWEMMSPGLRSTYPSLQSQRGWRDHRGATVQPNMGGWCEKVDKKGGLPSLGPYKIHLKIVSPCFPPNKHCKKLVENCRFSLVENCRSIASEEPTILALLLTEFLEGFFDVFLYHLLIN